MTKKFLFRDSLLSNHTGGDMALLFQKSFSKFLNGLNALQSRM